VGTGGKSNSNQSIKIFLKRYRDESKEKTRTRRAQLYTQNYSEYNNCDYNKILGLFFLFLKRRHDCFVLLFVNKQPGAFVLHKLNGNMFLRFGIIDEESKTVAAKLILLYV
jgi:hypothetical protein